jgi:ornithine cyclodeaminase/alanine dehydrogenase-like protein (mu-crystallin family)
MNPETSLPFVPADEVHQLLPYLDLVDAMAEGHLQVPAEVRRVVYGPAGSEQTFLGLPAWQPGQAIGVKLVTVFPGNLARGLPSVQAVYVLFDGQSGSPVAIVDGTALTYRKTACDSALGSRFLSRPDAATLLMVGAGGLAPHLVAAHRAVRPSIDRVLIWNRTRERAETLAARVEGAAVVDDLERAAGEADIISTATMSPDPLIAGSWLRPGTHLDLVGAFTPTTREIDDEAIRRGSVYVDSRLAAIEECGDLVIAFQHGILRIEDIRGDLFELCRGSVAGRQSEDEITVFENGGGGHLDLMAARFLWARRSGH